MADALEMKLDGTVCADTPNANDATDEDARESVGDSDREPGDVSPTIVISQSTRRSGKQAARRSSSIFDLTEREYQVLRIINTHGWCTAEIVREIARFHGLRWSTGAKRGGKLLRSLEQSELVASRRIIGGPRARAFAVTERGMRFIMAEGDSLLCDTNAIRDPASVYHFLGLNKIMLKFRAQFPTKFWLTDFEVRSDNSFIGEHGLAKDYDSVAELVLPSGTRARFGIEYERSKQNAARHEKLSQMLLAEKKLQFVLFFLNDLKLRNQLMLHLKKLAGFAYFVEYERFLQVGTDAPTYYWNEGKVYQAPLNTVLTHASRKVVPEYVPEHQLDLRVRR